MPIKGFQTQINLDELNDINVTSAADRQVLRQSGGTWINDFLNRLEDNTNNNYINIDPIQNNIVANVNSSVVGSQTVLSIDENSFNITGITPTSGSGYQGTSISAYGGNGDLGGNIIINAGESYAVGSAGGYISINAGPSQNGDGGAIEITAGTTTYAGGGYVGGDVSITSGGGQNTNDAGDVFIFGADSTGTGKAGDIILRPGTNASNIAHTVFIGNASSTETSKLKFESLSAGGTGVGFRSPTNVPVDITFTLPDSDGNNNEVLYTDGAANLGWRSTKPQIEKITITGSPVNPVVNTTIPTASPSGVPLRATLQVFKNGILQIEDFDGGSPINGDFIVSGTNQLTFAPGSLQAGDILVIYSFD